MIPVGLGAVPGPQPLAEKIKARAHRMAMAVEHLEDDALI